MIHFLHYFFAPQSGPWYVGNVWGNVVAVLPCGVLAWLWSRTKFWPLNLIHQKLDGLHDKHDEHQNSLDALHLRIEELHDKHDQLANQLNNKS